MPKKKTPAAPKAVPQVQVPIGDIKFCDLTHIKMTQEEAVLAFQSGNTISAYAFTPGHIKRLAKRLTEAVKSYEKKIGKIDTHETPPSKQA